MTSQDYVFIHGGAHGGWCWEATIAEMGRAGNPSLGRCIALDQPGCGAKRDWHIAHCSFEDVLDDQLAELDTLEVDGAVLVGHSMAGALLPELAYRRPDMFRQLVFLTCNVPEPGRSMNQTMGQGVHGADPDKVGYPLDPATTPRAELYRAMFCTGMDEAMCSALISRCLKENGPPVSVPQHKTRREVIEALEPCTYLLAREDAILPASWQRKFAETLGPDTRLIEMDGGHNLMMTHPEALAAMLLDLA